MSRFEPRPCTAFISYARADAYRKRIFLGALVDQALKEAVAFFDDRQLGPARDWKGQLDTYMAESDLILFLVTDEFLASHYCMEEELPAARRLAATGESALLAVRLSHCRSDDSALADLPAWPDGGATLDGLPDPDRAMAELRHRLKRMVVDRLKVKRSPRRGEHSLYWAHQLHGVALREPAVTRRYIAAGVAVGAGLLAGAWSLGVLPGRLTGLFTGLWLFGVAGGAAGAAAMFARTAHLALGARQPDEARPPGDMVDYLVSSGMFMLIGLAGGGGQGLLVGLVVGLLIGLLGVALDVSLPVAAGLGAAYGASQAWNIAWSTGRRHLRVFQELGELEAPPRPPREPD